MRDSGANLDPKLEEAIVALLTQRNVEEAARSIDSRTEYALSLAERPRVRPSLPGGPPTGIPAIDRAAAAGCHSGSHHTAQDDGGPERSALLPAASRRQRPGARSEGDRTGGYRARVAELERAAETAKAQHR